MADTVRKVDVYAFESTQAAFVEYKEESEKSDFRHGAQAFDEVRIRSASAQSSEAVKVIEDDHLGDPGFVGHKVIQSALQCVDQTVVSTPEQSENHRLTGFLELSGGLGKQGRATSARLACD